MRAAIDPLCQREDGSIACALIADRPELVLVEEPQGALEGQFRSNQVGVGHYVRPTDIIGERLEIKFAR